MMYMIIFLITAALLFQGCGNSTLTKSAADTSSTPGTSEGINIYNGSIPIPSDTGSFTFPATKKRYTITESFIIENTGSSNVTLSGSPMVTIAGATDFTVTSFPSLNISPGSRTSFSIKYSPTDISTTTASISIDSNLGAYAFDITGSSTDNSIIEDRSIYNADTLGVLEIHLLVDSGQEAAFDNLINWTCGGSTVPTYPGCLAYAPPPVNITFREISTGTSAVLFEQAGTLKLRGGSTRDAWLGQKSWKVELANSTSTPDLWRGQDNLNFNKHTYELTRMRNKLSFDIFKEIPNFTSMRTQFVEIKINRDTASTTQDPPVSYGIFTFIENGDKKFLKSHGLDDNGNLYKTKSFTFSSNGTDGDLEKLEAAIAANNTAAFDAILESKGNNDHTKLLDMIRDINAASTSTIDEVIDLYFNRDNYLTWLAINMITLNVDTQNQNFYLYSPVNSTVWYFLPWDYDGAWGWYFQLDQATLNDLYDYDMKTKYGPANYWATILHRLFLSNSQNVTDLLAKIDEIRTVYLTDVKIAAKIDIYTPIVNPYLLAAADCNDLPLSFVPSSCADAGIQTEINGEIAKLKSVVSETYTIAKYEFNAPVPVWLGQDDDGGGNITFSWDASYSLQGRALSYNFQLFNNVFTVGRISTTVPQFFSDNTSTSTSIYATSTLLTNYSTSTLANGTYYWRVLINDSGSYWQIPFSKYTATSTYGGMQCVVVTGGAVSNCP